MKLTTYTVLGAAVAAFAAACSGADGAAGPPGESVTSGDGSLSLVSPPQGLLDRELEVQIGGSATKFDPAAKPDFGAGITVEEVNAASPTLLVAKIKIAKDAPIGKRDVTIGNVVAKGAFSVIPAIGFDATKVEQGGVVQFAIDNNDTKAFDTSSFTLVGPGLIDLGSSASTGFAATGFVLAAPLATPAKGQIVVSNMGPDGNPRLSFASDPQAFEITARAPTTLAFGSSTETFAGDLASKLYKVSTPAGATAILDLRMEVDADADTSPYMFLFGSGGLEADQLALKGPPSSLFGPAPPPYDLHTTIPVLAGGSSDFYAVMVDLSKKAGTKLKLTAASINATTVAEAAGAHAQAAPQALTALAPADGQIVDANLAADAEVDAYQITAVDGDKVQIGVSSAADVEIIVTKDVNVLVDPSDATPDTAKVLTDFFAGAKAASSDVVTLSGQTTLYVVVKKDTQGKVATGKYALSARKVQ